MSYKKIKDHWDNVFSNETIKVPDNHEIPYLELDKAMNWLINKGDRVLDFGCGGGTLLFYANLKGATRLVGIDISEKGINLAKKRSLKMTGEYKFSVGDVASLKTLEVGSYDAVMLSNIIDNLTEEHMLNVLNSIYDILKNKGRVLIKVNDYIEPKDYKKYDIKVLNGDLVDDGLFLLNKSSNAWKKVFKSRYELIQESALILPHVNAKNRIFLLRKRDID